MNRTLKTMSKGVLLSGAIMLGALSSAPAQAQQVEISLFPPVWFRATTAPVYYEGHAAYWYGNRWYYRDGRDWRYYNDEPVHLRDYRSNRGHFRQHYEGGHRGRW